MRLQDDIDFTTLTWVKQELDDTLKQAQQALEAYVEDSSDKSQMRFCASYLHQVQGTLRMVELYGAAMVVEEMERLANGLLEGQIKQAEDAYTVLMRGMVQLPDYLERLQSGHRDIPIVLLPLLNDVRACRGEKLLSETALFSPDMAAALPAAAAGARLVTAPPLLAAHAGKLRLAFQFGLLRWFKGEDVEGNLTRLIAVLDRLRGMVQQVDTRRLLWVGAGALEAVLVKGIEASVALKLLVGRVDREIKRLIDTGEAGFAAAPPNDVTKGLLYYVAQCQKSSQRVAELRETYRLDKLIPTEAELEHARGALSGHNRALLDSVGVAIKDDLLRVKDALDLYLRTGSSNVEELAPQSDALHRVADTLGMLGLGVPRRVVLDQEDVLSRIVKGTTPADENVLLDIAGSLLFVESSLDDHIERLGAEQKQTTPAAPGAFELPQAEVRRILEATTKEAAANIQQAKQDIVAFIESPWDHSKIEQLPRLLEEISGAMRMLDMAEPADLLGGIVRFVEVELLKFRRVPSGEQLDLMADAIASIEFYLEAVKDGRRNRDKILEVTRRSLEALGYWPLPQEDAGLLAEEAPAAEVPVVAADSTAASEFPSFSPEFATERVEAAVFELPESAPALAEGSTDAVDQALADSGSLSLDEVIARYGEPVEAVEAIAAEPPVAEPELQVAVEIAPGESLESLVVGETAAEALAPITQDLDNLQVTAAEILEPASAEQVTAVESAQAESALDALEEALPEELELASEASAWTDSAGFENVVAADSAAEVMEGVEASIEALVEAASPVAEEPAVEAPFDLQVEPVVEAPPPAPAPPVAAAPAMPSMPGIVLPDVGFHSVPSDEIDDEIREVFVEEVQDELDNLNRQYPMWKRDLGDLENLKPVRRSFHTLKGSGRLVGALAIGEFAWKIENMLNRVLDKTIQPSPAVLDLLDHAIAGLPGMLRALKGEGQPDANVGTIMWVADQLASGQEVWLPKSSPAPQAAADAQPASEAGQEAVALQEAAAVLDVADQAIDGLTGHWGEPEVSACVEEDLPPEAAGAATLEEAVGEAEPGVAEVITESSAADAFEETEVAGAHLPLDSDAPELRTEPEAMATHADLEDEVDGALGVRAEEEQADDANTDSTTPGGEDHESLATDAIRTRPEDLAFAEDVFAELLVEHDASLEAEGQIADTIDAGAEALAADTSGDEASDADAGESLEAPIVDVAALAADLDDLADLPGLGGEGTAPTAMDRTDESLSADVDSLVSGQVPGSVEPESSNLEALSSDWLAALVPAASDEALDSSASAPAQGGHALDIDPTLLEILSSEVASHLQVIRAYLGECDLADSPLAVSEDLLRAVHTLNGALSMVDLPILTRVVAPMEGYLKRLRAKGSEPSAEGIAVLREASEQIAAVMNAVEGRGEVPDTGALAERVVALRDDLPVPEHPYQGFGIHVGDEAREIAVEPLDAMPADTDAPPWYEAAPDDAALVAVDADLAFLSDTVDAGLEAPGEDVEEVQEFAPGSRSLEEGGEAPVVLVDADWLADAEATLDALTGAVDAGSSSQGEDAGDGFLADLVEQGLDVAEESGAELEPASVTEGSEEDETQIRQEAEASSPGSLLESIEALDLEGPVGLDAEVLQGADLAEPVVADLADLAEWSVLDELEEVVADAADAQPPGDDGVAAPAEDAVAFAGLGPVEAEESAAVSEHAPESVLESQVPGDAMAELEELLGPYAEMPTDDAASGEEDAVAADDDEALAESEYVSIDKETAADPAIWSPDNVPEAPVAADWSAPLVWSGADASISGFGELAEGAEPAESRGSVLSDDDADGGMAADGRDEEAAGEAEEQVVEVEGQPSAPVSFVQHAVMVDVDPSGPLDLPDMDLELLDIFVEEGVDILDHADGMMARLRENPDDREVVAALQRDLHTLKGGARMAGLAPIGDLSHVMESLFEAMVQGERVVSRPAVDALERAFDRLHGMIQRVRARQAIAMPEQIIARIDAILEGREDELPVAPLAEPSAEPVPAAAAVETEEPAQAIEAAAASVEEAPKPAPPRPVQRRATQLDEEEAAARAAQQELIRVRADLLDNLVNFAGEVSIYRSRLEAQMGGFRFNLVEFDQTVTRLREQLRKLEIETEAQILSRFQRESEQLGGTAEFDPLELDRFSTLQQLSRALAESVSDLVSIQNLLDDIARQSETLLLQQSRVSSDLQEGLMRTRMVPFESLVPRLRRILRQTATELGKKAQLRVEGTQGEMDRTVLERMTAPFEHMLRNSLAHGIESPEQRLAAGKAEEGSVSIKVSREATEVLIIVTDDGGGMNRDAIRRKAEERGLMNPDANLSDRDIYQFVLESGFSTASEVSKVAGRGVGMDVVASEVKQLGGSLEIDSTPGQGTRITIRLPFTLAVAQAVLVRLGEATYAIPMTSITGVTRMPRKELDRRLEQGQLDLHYGGETYQIYDLGDLLRSPVGHSPDETQVPLLMSRTGDQRAAIRVSHVIGSKEVVVKSAGAQLSIVPGIFGATIMGDGRVVVILDVAPLVRHGVALRQAPELAAELELLEPAPEPVARRQPLVMVVDDSITMRKVTTRVLERSDYDVFTAKDGLDAVEQLQDRIPDVILLDIEMPRMDGYEVATYIRNDPRLKHIPIIMITSRTGEKHRQRALEVGVDRYLGKPYQETDLLKNVQDAVAAGHVHVH